MPSATPSSPSVQNVLSLRSIYAARAAIAGVAARTPLLPSPSLSKRSDVAIHLKLEICQPTGTFKVRGAANAIAQLSPAARERGVVTVSTGNHGRAVAHVANLHGLRAVICLSERVPANKVNALRRLGAEVVIHGQSQDDAQERADAFAADEGLMLIPPFDHPHIIAGQGTIGLELIEDLPSLRTVLVPLSGGGLIGGIAFALKSIAPDVRVIGVSMERAAVMARSLVAGRPLQMAEEETLADSLQGGIGLDNRYTFQLARKYVDETILLTEAEIAAGMAFALREHNLVLEGAGAVGIGALLAGKVEDLAGPAAVVLSGGNVAAETLLDVVQRQGK